MRLEAVGIVFLLIAIYFVMAVGAEVYIDSFVHPTSLFYSLLLGTAITTVAALPLAIDIPR